MKKYVKCKKIQFNNYINVWKCNGTLLTKHNNEYKSSTNTYDTFFYLNIEVFNTNITIYNIIMMGGHNL